MLLSNYMEDKIESELNPFPGYFVAIIDDSQLSNVSFKGDDNFDKPQTGVIVRLSPQDTKRPYDDEGNTYGSLLHRHVSWAKYAESDCLIYDNKLQKDVVLIAIDKLRGYE